VSGREVISPLALESRGEASAYAVRNTGYLRNAPEFTPAHARLIFDCRKGWCRKRDSNPRPRHYEAEIPAVPIIGMRPANFAGVHVRKGLGDSAEHSAVRSRPSSSELSQTRVNARNCNRAVTTG